MQLNNVRRSALVSPFGPGALQVLKEGVSVITAGLDHWFETNDNPTGSSVNREEFKIREWRLERELGVDYFMQPPEFRRPPEAGMPGVLNAALTIPVQRFPTWYVCRFCNGMQQAGLSTQGHVMCQVCAKAGKPRTKMSQVRFVALCDHGHLQDFPWLEWVHRTATPTCQGPLKFEARGGSLRDIRISCTTCKSSRGMEMVTSADAGGERSYLTDNLLSDGKGTSSGKYNCQGVRPWLGPASSCGCARPLRAALRSATNVHYGDVKSSIYLPSTLFVRGAELGGAKEALKDPGCSVVLGSARELEMTVDDTIKALRRKAQKILSPYTDEDLKSALCALWDLPQPDKASPHAAKVPPIAEDRWTAFRRKEFTILSDAQNEDDLIVTPQKMTDFSAGIRRFVGSVNLVEKLRETRVFTGFSRVIAGGGPDEKAKMSALRLEQPPPGHMWLPAYCVFGEGLFITLNEDALKKWESRKDVAAHAQHIEQRALRVAVERNSQPRTLPPRFFLLHTLAHLLINRLNYECGYSSASLRERLYVSADAKAPMSGVLIYTSSGDSEGTLGGLVRMGKSADFERVITRALEGARWCSNDPVCMESGDHGGQGPDSLNGAACHSCALLPETSCEEFNRLLDRALVIGTFDQPSLGFFS